MATHAAFLRGINLGRRRLTNEDLVACLAELGCGEPAAFLASGNAAFTAPAGLTGSRLEAHLAEGFERSFGYAVRTFVRDAAELAAIAGCQPFRARAGADGGKLQVALLAAPPTAALCRHLLQHASEDDRLAVAGRELYWLPRAGISQSALDLAALERLTGTWTMRTHNTVLRLVGKFFDPV